MADLVDTIHYVQIGIILITSLLALIYTIPILFLRRFQNFDNIFTVNLCFSIICCNIYWIIYYCLLKLYPECLNNEYICSILVYFEMMCTFQVPLAFLAVSINRLCLIVYYTKAFFRRKLWIILCISIQWIVGIIFSIPRIPLSSTNCDTPLWMRIYIFLMIVIQPTIIGISIYLIIFNYVHSSTHRVQPAIEIISNNIHNPQLHRINQRDKKIVRRMIIMFSLFIGGWCPIYLYLIIIPDYFFTFIVSTCLILLAQLCLLIDIINLFIYNQKLRKYLQNFIFKCSNIEQ